MTEDLLIQRIEETCGAIGMEIAGQEDLLWRVPLDGVAARCSALSDPVLNLVGLAALPPESADAGIAAVLDYYRAQGKTVSWIVGPTSRPGDLGARLVAQGFNLIPEEAMSGMVLTPLEVAAPIAPGITVRQVSAAEAAPHHAMMAAAYGFPATEDFFKVWFLLLDALGDRAAFYLTWLEGVPDPVAWSSALFHADGQTMALGGSATLAAYRHRGLYTAMVAERLRDGRARGCTTAVIQAVKATSAPICEKLGFRTICSLDMYNWWPPGPAPR